MWCLSLIVLSVIFDVGNGTRARLDIRGKCLFLVDGTNPSDNKYSCKFNSAEALEELICIGSGLVGSYELILQDERGDGTRQTFNYCRQSLPTYHEVHHTFKLTSESRTISCSARDVHSNITKYTSTVDLKFEPSSTAAPSTTPTNTKTTVDVLTTWPTEPQPSENGLWKPVVIAVAAIVSLFVVILSLVLVCRQKKAQPPVLNYANLTNDTQHQNMPVPALRKPVPTVEGTYSEPKDSNDMSEALYADPKVFSAICPPDIFIKSEDTYAEPYNAINELYATPIPKAQRINKFKDDPNYSNLFGKD